MRQENHIVFQTVEYIYINLYIIPLYFSPLFLRGVTGNAALYWVSIDIELRCLTLYLAATAQLPCHKTFFSPNRVDARHHLCRFSAV